MLTASQSSEWVSECHLVVREGSTAAIRMFILFIFSIWKHQVQMFTNTSCFPAHIQLKHNPEKMVMTANLDSMKQKVEQGQIRHFGGRNIFSVIYFVGWSENQIQEVESVKNSRCLVLWFSTQNPSFCPSSRSISASVRPLWWRSYQGAYCSVLSGIWTLWGPSLRTHCFRLFFCIPRVLIQNPPPGCWNRYWMSRTTLVVVYAVRGWVWFPDLHNGVQAPQRKRRTRRGPWGEMVVQVQSATYWPQDRV